MREIIETYINPVYFRVSRPIEVEPSDLFILIHGWLGNEKSMSIFTSSIPENATVIFPRGIVNLHEDRYGWVDFQNSPTSFEDYAEKSKELISSISELINSFELNEKNRKLNLIGFSQGAAMCVVLSMLFPEYFNKIAILAGFLPKNPPSDFQSQIASLEFYIAHGTDDQMVSFQSSIELREYLEERRANVHFCKEDIGHKVGKTCLKNLKLFFNS